jgi:TetR/AcrR family transcriptional regulator, lmrAB and yxaGH operons repressor
MPRPASDAPERLIEASIVLLRRGGLHAAGLNPIIAMAGAPKGSLYHHFPLGHHQLIGQALARYGDRVSTQLCAALQGTHALDARVKRLFLATAERVQRTDFTESCAVGAVLADVSGASDALRQQCQTIVQRWASDLATRMPELARGDRSSFARQLITLLEGAQLMARAQRSTQALREAGAMASRQARALQGQTIHSETP